MTVADDLLRDYLASRPAMTPEHTVAAFFVLGHAAHAAQLIGEPHRRREWVTWVSGWDHPGAAGTWELELRVAGRRRWWLEVTGNPTADPRCDRSYTWAVSEEMFPLDVLNLP